MPHATRHTARLKTQRTHADTQTRAARRSGRDESRRRVASRWTKSKPYRKKTLQPNCITALITLPGARSALPEDRVLTEHRPVRLWSDCTRSPALSDRKVRYRYIYITFPEVLKGTTRCSNSVLLKKKRYTVSSRASIKIKIQNWVLLKKIKSYYNLKGTI